MDVGRSRTPDGANWAMRDIDSRSQGRFHRSGAGVEDRIDNWNRRSDPPNRLQTGLSISPRALGPARRAEVTEIPTCGNYCFPSEQSPPSFIGRDRTDKEAAPIAYVINVPTKGS